MMNDHHALFSTLEAAAAGFHTGRALVIVDKHLESRVVYHHEMSHGKIFQECTDGNLHVCVITALESEHFKNDHAELKALNRYLFDTTRIAHERVATYLGVQSLSSEREMVDAIKMMPPAYLDYYNFFGTKLDQIASSYVRYLVAWAAGRLAFNSGRAQGIDGRRLFESVKSIVGPTERLDAIGAYLDRLTFPDLQKLVLGCAVTSFDAAKVEPFDIMRDDEWNVRVLSDQPGLQRFDATMLVELGSALSSLIPLGHRDEVLLTGYFAPIAQRFLLRRAPPDMKSDGTTHSYDLALELASRGDEMRINRSAPLAPNPYNAARISQWIDENAQQQIFVSAVEVPGSRGVYKLFLSNGHGLGSSYAPGIPCLVTGAELSSILSLVQSACSQRGVPIPPFFLFSKSGRREDREFSGFTPPQRSEWVFWRPYIDLLPRPYLRIFPFFIETDKWARLIEAYKGTWSQINPTFGIPSDGDEFPLAVMFLFPRQKDWIPHLRLTTKSGAALYFPLLQWSSVKSRLKYTDFPASAASVAHATLSLWETFDTL